MKKFLILIISLILITGCRNTDSIMFKDEFEKLNGNDNYTKVNIKSDNPFIYITDSKLLEKLNNKEDLIVLFGYNKSNDTRLIIENIINICNDLNIDKIYYLDIFDIRDEKNVNQEGVITTTEEGTKSYNEILTLLNDKLDDYVVQNTVVGKRIYAPTILISKNNNIELMKGLNAEDTEAEKKKKSYDLILSLFKNYNSNNNTCSVNEGC